MKIHGQHMNDHFNSLPMILGFTYFSETGVFMSGNVERHCEVDPIFWTAE